MCIRDSIYSKPTYATPQTNAYNEWLQYDINGNIQKLNRYGGADTNQAVQIDQLNYTYSGNQLTKVADATGNPSGYPSLSVPNTINYDANGNMIKPVSYTHLYGLFVAR